jgi:hypothetical protein
MEMIKRIQPADVGEMHGDAARGWDRLVAGLRGLLPRQAVAPDTTVERVDEATAAALFAQALYEDSNLELDWLWLATQVTRDVERRYCLQRALHINPQSEIARWQLLKLRVAMATAAAARVAAR